VGFLVDDPIRVVPLQPDVDDVGQARVHQFVELVAGQVRIEGLQVAADPVPCQNVCVQPVIAAKGVRGA
jgi:hypothetical protein